MTSNKNIKSLDNEYIRSNPEKKKQLAHRKRVLKRRRLVVFFIFALTVLSILTGTVMKQNERLAAKELEKQQIEEQLKQLEDQKEMLKVQIAKLEDDDYIAKLARKEYFLSEEGEIIFSIPKKDDSVEESESEKE